MSGKILVFGSRNWADRELVDSTIRRLRDDGITAVVHGCCRGADTMAGESAYKLSMDVYEYPADWKGLGTKAGPVRNSQMLAENSFAFAVAFHDGLRDSKGSFDMMKKCISNGVRVLHVSHDNPEGVWL